MGEQIAENRTTHLIIELFEDEQGRYRVKVIGEKFTLIQKEYIPRGNQFKFPKRWGMEDGVAKLLEFKRLDWERIIEVANQELEKLKSLEDEIHLWKNK
jgi:uncharacterized protein with HEPN domain